MVKLTSTLTGFVRPSEHSTYSPSSMDRIIGCPASINICRNIPEEPAGSYAEEGTVAHEHAEHYFYWDMYGIEIPIKTLLAAKDYSSYGDMVEGAKTYSNTIQSYLSSEFLLGKILWFGLEKGIPVFPEEGAFGTGDCIIVGERGAVVIDYKFGNKKVHPDSLQLKTYAAGVVKHLLDVPDDYSITCVIVQPRVSASAEAHSYRIDEIRSFTVDLKNTIDATKQPGLAPIEGNHCFWCPASRTKNPAFKCPAKKQKVMNVLENDFKSLITDVTKPVQSFKDQNVRRDEALKKIIGLRDIVNEVADQAFEEFKYRLEKGEKIEGVILVNEEGSRKWRINKDEEMYNELIKSYPQFSTKLVKTVPETNKLVTVTEFEKLAGKGSADSFTVKKIEKKVSIIEETLQKIKLGFMGFINSEDQNKNDLI